jgi:CRISPR-associated exonuclease Cas4
MMARQYTEDDLLPISALQHLLFCERQCALIHIEQAWDENRLTAEGRIMHERVHSGGSDSRKTVRVEYGVPLRSLGLGLIGKADVVEFHLSNEKSLVKTRSKQIWKPFPVEYKRGKPKKESWDRVQLCAQALCLEEMLDIHVKKGALFYGKTRRRQDVSFDVALRREMESAAGRLHELVESGRTPDPVYVSRCRRCSLVSLCMPKMIEKAPSVEKYLLSVMKGQ